MKRKLKAHDSKGAIQLKVPLVLLHKDYLLWKKVGSGHTFLEFICGLHLKGDLWFRPNPIRSLATRVNDVFVAEIKPVDTTIARRAWALLDNHGFKWEDVFDSSVQVGCVGIDLEVDKDTFPEDVFGDEQIEFCKNQLRSLS